MELILPAYAKLNLTLDVNGRRANGYHEVDSVMQTISLHDVISVERTDCRVFDVVGPAISGENLVLKAARELEGHVGRALPFTIRLFKRIPMFAGLGGGSADAAAFLLAAVQLYDLPLKQDALVELATAVGQDVPFFLSGGTARATGLGSTVEPLPELPGSWRFVVVCPPVEVPTRAVYEAVEGTAPTAHRTPALVERLRSARAIDPGAFGNDLEATARRLFPSLDQAIAPLAATLPGLRMSGSGAAFFAAFPGDEAARAGLRAAQQAGAKAWLCRPVPAWR
ncbi:MAG: 4-(cytidine 5'-diphospho)-2-C-methyl-D-erythritol kinase [Candidatus Dormibacteraeota bacterium]|nr:4-(cytidine 5'-diphospho)-2-C-methyl-D-erythritol kinase [Candidatus Dormibacteraeota bacterium]